MGKIGKLTVALAAGMALMAPLAAQALVININPVSGGGLDTGASAAAALAAFNRAADRWESLFSDPVTLEIDADLRNLGSSSIIGQAGSTLLAGGFDLIRNAMVSDASDESDDAIVGFLPDSTGFSAFLPGGFSLLDAVVLTQANALALGFPRITPSDALIEFNSGFSFDFDSSDGLMGMDFETVALHEIGHALGFVSVVDEIDFRIATDQADAVAVMPFDLFRFGDPADPSSTSDFTSFARWLVPGFPGFFDDLDVELALSTGFFNGDGRQASHWRDNDLSGVLLGVMDPTLPFNTIYPLSENDLRLLDRIGWDYRLGIHDVPEPMTLSLLGAGLAGMGWMRRRRAA